MIRPGCPFSTSSDANIGEVACLEWNDAALSELELLRPDAVVAGASRNVRVGQTEETPPGFVEAWRRMDAAGVPVLAVRDNPRFDYEPAECVETFGRGAPECAVPREQLYAPEGPFARVDAPPNVTFYDASDQLCTDQVCPPEIGNVTVYLDNNHLTRTFAASMAPALAPDLERAVDG